MINTEERITTVEKRVDNLETTFKLFMQEMRDFKTEMRQQNQMRAEEIREIRQDMREMQNRFYTKIDDMNAKMDSKFESLGNHVRNLSVATIIGVATIAITVIYSIFTR